VRLATRVVGIDVTGDGVVLRARTEGEGADRIIRARYAVACDGASSTVRELLGLRLRDLGFDEQWLVIDLIVDSKLLLPDRAVYVCEPARPHVLIPLPGRRHRIEVKLLPGEAAVFVQRAGFVRRLLTELIGSDKAEVERAAVYAFHGLISEQWRHGPVLLAGDAAHQMPPFLGQGMCSGIRDAANLAWKLDLVLRKRAADRLLDSYQAEREPHVESIIRQAIAYGEIVGTLDPKAAAARDARLRADRAGLVFQLPPLAPGPLVLEGGGSLFAQPTIGGKPLDDIIGQRFLVLGRDRAALDRSVSWWRDNVDAHVATLDELDAPTGPLNAWLERRSAAVVVVRPDRYVLASTSGPLDRTVEDCLSSLFR
jgi:3-(3-hydroxy-phenyl)propionate hydroxylase